MTQNEEALYYGKPLLCYITPWLGMSYNFNSFKQKGEKKSEMDRSLIRLGM